MAINDKAVITPGTGFVYTAPVGWAAPTPAELAALNPITFGAKSYIISATGTPTGGGWTVGLGAENSASIPPGASAGTIQAAIENIPGIGAGNVYVTGTVLAPSTPVTVYLVGALQGESLTLTVDDSGLTGGTSPTVTIADGVAPNGWKNIGHTSREDMPEFGFDGGETETRGTWQNSQLRQTSSEAPADYLVLQVQQADESGLELYYGANASSTPGVFGVAGGTPPVNERAVLVVIVDGTVNLGFHASKAAIGRDDSIAIPSDDFLTLPIRATFLKLGQNLLYSWINEDFYNVS